MGKMGGQLSPLANTPTYLAEWRWVRMWMASFTAIPMKVFIQSMVFYNSTRDPRISRFNCVLIFSHRVCWVWFVIHPYPFVTCLFSLFKRSHFTPVCLIVSWLDSPVPSFQCSTSAIVNGTCASSPLFSLVPSSLFLALRISSSFLFLVFFSSFFFF